MEKPCKLICLLVFFFQISACEMHHIRFEETTASRKIEDYHFEQLKEYQVKKIDLDYIANCKIRVKTSEDAYSGSCRVVLTHKKEFQLTIFHPMGGIMMLVYADNALIQIVDRSENEFHQLENNSQNRKRIPVITSLTFGELQSILWGREIDETRENLIFKFKKDKPWQVYKKAEGQHISVKFMKWLKYRNLFFPEIIQVMDKKENISIKIAMTKFTPGFAGNLKIKDATGLKTQ